MRILLAAASSGGNPSAVATVLIALVGAVVGGLITAWGQFIVEGRRAEHERKIESARAERDAAALEREERLLVRASARLMQEDIGHRRVVYQFALSRGTWWPTEAATPHRATAEDHRTLAIHISPDAWMAVVRAERAMELQELARGPEAAPIIPSHREGLETVVSSMDEALAALEPLVRAN